MSLFGGIVSIQTITYLMFTVFIIGAVGYAFGRISIKGVTLGTAGVFIVALLYGCFFYDGIESSLMVEGESYAKNALKILENFGLILFVTSVGFIAGPNFFGDFKKNFKSYVVLALIIIVTSGLACVGCILVGQNFTNDSLEELTAMVVGLLSGSLTSTPAFSAAKDTVAPELQDIVTVGHGISYLFGVIGVVLFVQLVPKIVKADMDEERKKLVVSNGNKKEFKGELIKVDPLGFMAFSLASILGIFVGSIKIGNFSLTTTGGCLLVSLVLGHFARIGSIKIAPEADTAHTLRELGLMLFLIGAGVAGGASFIKYFQAVYFVYGAIMTIVPLVVGFIFAKYVLKLSLLNNLGSITGGMTSTPALGTLISTAGTENVAAAYASTYPMALISVVIVSQVIILLFR